MRGVRRRKRSPAKAVFLLALCAALLFLFAEHRLSAVRGEIQQAALRSFAMERISETAAKCLREVPSLCGEDVTLDTYALAEMKNTLTKSLGQALTDTAVAWVPVGNLSGLALLNGAGFSVPVSFRVEGVAQVDFSTALESAGINRTRYGVTMRVTAELYSDSVAFPQPVTVTTEYPVFETVTSGEVPGVYAGTAE